MKLACIRARVFPGQYSFKLYNDDISPTIEPQRPTPFISLTHVPGLLLVPKIGTLKLLGGRLRRLKIEMAENCNKPIAKRIGLRCMRR
jgi:hypothetical protein